MKRLIDIQLIQSTKHVENYSSKLQEKEDELKKACRNINKFLKSSDISFIKGWQPYPQEGAVQPVSPLFRGNVEAVGKTLRNETFD